MHNLRRLLQRLIHAIRPERAEPDLAREVAAHLTLIEDEYVRQGMTREQARVAARRALGGVESAKHAHRDARSIVWLDEFLTDVKYSVRRFRSRPGTNVLAVAMLAVAVGLSTAMFTIVDALIVRPLPFPHADRLARVMMASQTGSGRTVVDAPVLNAWQQSHVFERAEGALPFTGVIESAAGPTAREGAVVTPGLFDMLGVRPLRGRLFDTHHPNEDEVLLSAALWRTAFHGDEAIVGQEIRLDGERRVVVGILPPGFRFPAWNTDVWRAGLVADRQSYQAFVRLAEGVPEEDALRMATELAYATGTMANFPSTWRATSRPIVGMVYSNTDTYYRRAVPFLAGAVALVALVLCANVGSLLLTRLRARRREFGVCAALGASRGRLLRQALIESVLLGVCGAAAGVALAWASVSVAAAVLPQAFLTNSLNPLALDLRALSAAVAIGFAATCAAGAIPAWLGTRVRGDAASRLIERHGTETRRGRVTVRALLVAEVALACALLVGATLLARSFVNVSHIDRGFDPAGVVALRISFEGGTRPPAERQAAAAGIEDLLTTLPGVRQTAWSSGVPMDSGMLYISDWTTDAPGATSVDLQVETFAVGQDYFDFYGIPLLRGRSFAPDDGPDVVIVGERMAAALWPDGDPIGRTISWDDRRAMVIGVARETRRQVIDEGLDWLDMYTPFTGLGWSPVLSLRCDGACPSEGVLRQQAQASGYGTVHMVMHLDEAFARDLEQPRASAALAGTFALVALMASAVGLFGVLSYAVQERRREFGIRAAIGATPAAIAKVVFREGAIVGVTGLALGAVLSVALASVLASLSYEASASDPANVAIVVATLAGAILLALWRPARSAARTDPALLLREET